MTHLTRGVLAKIVALVLLMALLPTLPAGSQAPAGSQPPPGSPPPPGSHAARKSAAGSQPPEVRRPEVRAGSPPPTASQDQAPKPFTAEELEQIVAPIALYPDPLLAQVFMASTYPLEVVQAARFVKANPSLKDPALNEELKKYDWDDSVKSLVSFPQVLTMMDEKLDWTQKLGDAFLDQQARTTMDAVQRLRAKAQAAGNLKSTPEQKVTVEPAPADTPPPPPTTRGSPPPPPPPTQIITIEPANPQVVYVPTYNPTVVYGAWPYPAYPPYSYYPPGYVAARRAISFGVGMAVGAALWGDCNWGGGDVDININKYNNFTKNVNNSKRQSHRSTTSASAGPAAAGRVVGSTIPSTARARSIATARPSRSSTASGPQNTASRDAYRGRAEPGTAGSGGGAGGQNVRAAAAPEVAVGSAGGDRPGGGPSAATRPSGGGAGGAGGGRQAGAFEGMGGQSRDVGAASQRGQSSMGSARSSGPAARSVAEVAAADRAVAAGRHAAVVAGDRAAAVAVAAGVEDGDENGGDRDHPRARAHGRRRRRRSRSASRRSAPPSMRSSRPFAPTIRRHWPRSWAQRGRPLVSSGDPVSDRTTMTQFVADYDQRHQLEAGGGKVILKVGSDDFPLPIPLVPDGPSWRWDTEAGKEEILNRRVGRNELTTIQVCLAYVDAQREYYSRARTKNGILEYAQRLGSSPGKRDGLYWPTREREPLSPLGDSSSRPGPRGTAPRRTAVVSPITATSTDPDRAGPRGPRRRLRLRGARPHDRRLRAGGLPRGVRGLRRDDVPREPRRRRVSEGSRREHHKVGRVDEALRSGRDVAEGRRRGAHALSDGRVLDCLRRLTTQGRRGDASPGACPRRWCCSSCWPPRYP